MIYKLCDFSNNQRNLLPVKTESELINRSMMGLLSYISNEILCFNVTYILNWTSIKYVFRS